MLAALSLLTRMLFVASDGASFSTGSEFIADGGHLLRRGPRHECAEAAAPSMRKAGRRAFQVKEQI
jgi:hypothetical protein